MEYEVGSPYLIDYPSGTRLSVLIDKNYTDLTFYDGSCFQFSYNFIKNGNVKVYPYTEEYYTEELDNEFIKLILEIEQEGKNA